MAQFIALLIPFLLIAFWLWMFDDMLSNDDIPSSNAARFRWPPEAKNQWMMLFIVLNIFTAGYYYFTGYKRRSFD